MLALRAVRMARFEMDIQSPMMSTPSTRKWHFTNNHSSTEVVN
jgi:hypothetical protein